MVSFSQTLLILLLIPMVAFSYPLPPTTTTAVRTSAHLRPKIAMEGYIYGYPLVLMAETEAALVGPKRPCGSTAGPNTFTHNRKLRVPGEDEVVRPNRDTLYSIAFLNLEAGPVVLDLPPESKRYVVFGLLDAYSNNFAGLGTPTHGAAGGKYVIAGPDWVGRVSDLPVDAVLVKSPTNLVWMIGRTEVLGPADIAAVNTIQDTYSLKPLNGSQLRPTAECVPADKVVTPPEAVSALTTSQFFHRLNSLMAKNPPPRADAHVVAKLAEIGVGPGTARSKGDLYGIPSKLSELSQVAEEKSGASSAGLLSLLQNRLEQWIPSNPSPMTIGDYGTNYRARFLIARVGFGAIRQEFAVYQNAEKDLYKRAFDGSKHSYTITFSKGKLPPVTGFWSVSVYDSEGYFVEHPSGQYIIGTHFGLVADADGSTTIHLSAT